MQIRPELSNGVITIATGKDAISVLARPRRPWLVLIACALVMLFSLLPTTMMPGTYRRVMAGRIADELLPVGIALLPGVMSAGVVYMVLTRVKRKRGVEIIDGTVTLHTPDSTTSQYVFDRNDLKGAVLVGGAQAAILRVERRSRGSVPVFLGYSERELQAAMDTINSMVVDNRYHGFEVIPLAQTAPPPEREQR